MNGRSGRPPRRRERDPPGRAPEPAGSGSSLAERVKQARETRGVLHPDRTVRRGSDFRRAARRGYHEPFPF